MKIKGLSLVELIIVLALIGTLVFLGVPTYGRFYSFVQLWGDERRITSDLREFHQRSISDHYDYRFTGLSKTGYKIDRYDGATWIEEVKSVDLEKGVYFDSATSNTITFHPLGNADPLGEITIVIKNNEGDISTVFISSTTGHVSIQ